jgi:SHS family lactate transporter-like MFS transporter
VLELNAVQKRVVLASFLGWTLDAFDFFILVFTLREIAATFDAKVPDVAYAIFLTLAMRFIGAFIFGRLGDKYGRKPILMLDIVSYSVLGALAAFAPTLSSFLVLRALFGIAMGGEWGLGSSLAMESIPPKSRGMVSGLLQCGYPTGFLLASAVFGLFYKSTLFGHVIDWRAMFLFSIAPAFLVLFIRSFVPESPAFLEAKGVEAKGGHRPKLMETLAANWQVSVFAIVMMMVFNLFSHGTQDLYPVFLQKEHGFEHGTVSLVLIVANLGAITGGLFFGALSERIGRVNAITIASLIALPAIPFWAYGSTAVVLALGAFIMQVGVQGAWGVVPAHLNELSPGPVRATLPGVVYQIGNFLASYNGPFQAKLAEEPGHTYSYALALVAGVVAVALAILIRFSPEKRGAAISVTA